MGAAVPDYVGQDFSDAPPGHRFGLYFDAWDQQWKIPASEKREALKRLAPLNTNSQKLLNHLRARQKAVADLLGDSVWRLPAQSTSPFMTGTGMEHPLENGFAFLNPYGLPYLPGSGVKGVLRRAVELLAAGEFGDRQNWDADAIDALFGNEPQSGDTETARNRGALMFWDVLPELAGNSLKVEIMTPHYGDYYQGNTTPHDSGQPNPIVFLALPPNSRFEFFVQCNRAALPESLRSTWQALLESAFQHAFDWLGFGAKTAVGYGQFPGDAIDEARVQRESEMREQRKAEEAKQAEMERQKKLAEMSPLDRAIEEIVAAAPKDQPHHKALLQKLKQGQWSGEEAQQVAEHIRDLMQKEGIWRIKSEKKKPEKDDPYQATLATLAYLEGKKS